MDIQARKILFIQEVLRLKNEKIIDKLERILHQERKRMAKKEINPMTIEQLNSIIDQAEEDAVKNRLYSAEEILKDIDSWE
jgi:hypothetical protein